MASLSYYLKRRYPFIAKAESSTFTYNSSNQIDSISETVGGLSRETTFSYNSDGDVSSIQTTFNGNITRTETYTYDSSDNITQVDVS